MTIPTSSAASAIADLQMFNCTGSGKDARAESRSDFATRGDDFAGGCAKRLRIGRFSPPDFGEIMIAARFVQAGQAAGGVGPVARDRLFIGGEGVVALDEHGF